MTSFLESLSPEGNKNLIQSLLDKLILTMYTPKGGVGKTTLALEIAYIINAILIDFEFQDSSSTTKLGYYAEDPESRPHHIHRALKNKQLPVIIGSRKPHFVPGYPQLASIQNDYTTEYIAEQILNWQKTWKNPIVIDTHPESATLANAALAVSNWVITPSRISPGDLIAIRQILKTLQTYESDAKLLIVPNFLSPSTNAKKIDNIEKYLEPLLEHKNVYLADGIPYSERINDRDRPATITEINALADQKTIHGIENIITSILKEL